MGRGKSPRWESELWSLVSSGDGTRCPLIHQCGSKIDFVNYQNIWENIQQSIDNEQFNIEDVNILEIQTESGRPCRVLHLVERLADSYVKMGKTNSPPVPTALLRLIELQHPVEVRSVPLVSYHGAIWWMNNGSWVIQINENDTPSTQRLSIFHEVFHILAHRKCAPVFRRRGTKEGSFNEMLADYFAIYILMPRELVTEKWAEVNDLKKMAEIFDVPQPAMCIRLKRLGLIQ